MSATTITLTKSQVPEYLKQGELFRTLMENNNDLDEEVTFPANALKPDTSVNCLEDCELLLNSLRFWGVAQVALELVSYVLASPSPDCIEVLRSFGSAADYMPSLIGMAAATPPDRGAIAIKSGRIELVEALAGETFPADASDLAAAVGSLDVLLYLFHNGHPWNFNTPNIAATHGHTHMYTFLCEQGFDVDHADLVISIMKGHLELVEFIHSRKESLFTSEAYLVDIAASRGHVHILPFFDRIGTLWADHTCEHAAGQLNCLKFLHEHGCAWGERALLNAAMGGHLACMQYMHDQGCPVHPDTCASAAEHGQLKCLTYAHRIGGAWDASTCRMAAKKGSLECLQYAHENNCTWDESACEAAATEGHIHILQYLHRHGCSWDAKTCRGAASNGYLVCLQYAHEHGCAWDASTTDIAGLLGRLPCLMYAHQNGCPLRRQNLADLHPLHNCCAYVNQHAV